jgi:transcriptional regulator with XRE-family HTH domain
MPRKSQVCLKFGRTVRRLRHELGLSQEGLADRAKIHRTYIGGIERGERNPTLTMIVRLAEVLEVSPARLLEAEGPETIESADAGR